MKKLTIIALSIVMSLSLLQFGGTALAEEVEIATAAEAVEVQAETEETSEEETTETGSGEEIETKETETEEETEAESEAEIEAEEPETETKAEPATETETEAKAEQETETEAEPATEPETEAVAETEAAEEVTEAASSADAEEEATASLRLSGKKVSTQVEEKNSAATTNAKVSSTPAVKKLSMPVLKACASTNEGIKISWQAVKDAKSYDIYWWHSASKSWKKFASTTGTSYVDKKATAGRKYYYTVSARNGNVVSQYDYNGRIGVFLKGTKVKVKQGNNTAELSWPKVDGAEGYRLYWRNHGEKSWHAYKWVTKNSYSDKISKAGVSYEYLVRAYTNYGGKTYFGFYNDSYKAGFTLLTKPALKSTSNANAGINLTWQKVEGAKGYNIYKWSYKANKYIKVATTRSTSYLDKQAKRGVAIYYTVAAYDAFGNVGPYVHDGIIGFHMPSAKISSLVNRLGAVRVSWAKNNLASGYRVYKRTPGGKWARLADVGSSATYYDDKSGSSGTKYEYLVVPFKTLRGTKHVGYLNNSNARALIKLNAPSVTVSMNANKSFTVNWNKIAGAKKYRLYRMVKGEQWVQLAETTALSYTDKKVSDGLDYYYMVRAVNGTVISGYKSSSRAKIIAELDLPSKRYVDLGWNVDPRNSWGPADYCKNTTKVNTKYWTYHNTYKGDTYKPKAGDIITYGPPDANGTTQGHVDICVKGYDSKTGEFTVVTGNWGSGHFTESAIATVSKSWSRFTTNKSYHRTIANIWECKLPAEKRNILVRTANKMQSAYMDNPANIRGKILGCKYNNWCDVFVAYTIYVAR